MYLSKIIIPVTSPLDSLTSPPRDFYKKLVAESNLLEKKRLLVSTIKLLDNTI